MNTLGKSVNKMDNFSKAEINGMASNESAQQPKREPVKAEKTVGRNEPCPCGSGKKYKQCCGKKN